MGLLLRIVRGPVLRILDHADDGVHSGGRLIPVAKVRADWILAVKIFFDEGLIHNGHVRGSAIVAVGKRAALQQLGSDGREIA